MSRKQYEESRYAAAASAAMDPSNPFNWGLEDKEQARKRLLEHIEQYTQKFGTDGVPIITAEVRAQLFAFASNLETLADEAKGVLVKADTALTPDPEDDEFVRMYAYIKNGKTEYAKTREEARMRSTLADLDKVRVAFVVPQQDGTYKEISLSPSDGNSAAT